MILNIIVSTNGLLYEDSHEDIALTKADLSSMISKQYISQDFQLMIRFRINEWSHAKPLDQDTQMTTRAPLNIKTVLPGMWIPMLKIRRSQYFILRQILN